MKRSTLGLCVLLSAAASLAQSIPELFGKVKEEVKAGSWADALKTLDSLDAASSKPGNEAVQKQLEGPLAFYRGVCQANLKETDLAVASFGAFLELQPTASIDPAVYSKKAVAAFEKAQKAAADRAPSLAEAYKEFQPPPDAKEIVDGHWGEGPVRWIMTAQETKHWSSLTDPNARIDFVEKFWVARQALPGSDRRTFRQEFARRAAFADATLEQQAEQKGSLTDRGMVFVLLSPPTYAGRRPLRTGDDAGISDGISRFGSQDAANAARSASAGGTTSGKLAIKSAQFAGAEKVALESANNFLEIWRYRQELLPKGAPYQQVDFQFLTKKGYGANVLQRESPVLTTLEVAKSAQRP
jgi:GWxTD domain-containing protein